MIHAISLGIILFVSFVIAVIIVVMALYEKHSDTLPDSETNEEDNVIFKG